MIDYNMKYNNMTEYVNSDEKSLIQQNFDKNKILFAIESSEIEKKVQALGIEIEQYIISDLKQKTLKYFDKKIYKKLNKISKEVKTNNKKCWEIFKIKISLNHDEYYKLPFYLLHKKHYFDYRTDGKIKKKFKKYIKYKLGSPYYISEYKLLLEQIIKKFIHEYGDQFYDETNFRLKHVWIIDTKTQSPIYFSICVKVSN